MAESNPQEDEMKVDPARAAELATNLARTLQSIKAASRGSNRPVRLVAVSKLKPPSDILALAVPPPSSPSTTSTTSSNPNHTEPHLHFGENYTQELQHKASLLPSQIKWHFIGALQTNKCRSLAESVPNLWAVESVDSAKKASALDRGRAALRERLKGQEPGGAQVEADPGPLRVFMQLNTSGEESKSGVPPGGEEALELVRHVEGECENLRLQGVMTIGAIARSEAAAQGEGNEDFVVLKRERDRICEEMGWAVERLELSMGMSADYEEAIRQGSDEVRVGTGIFGSRPPKNVAKVEKHDEEGGKEEGK